MPHTPIPNILSVLTFLPLVGAVLLLFMKRPKDLPEHHGGSHDAHSEERKEDDALEPRDPARVAVNIVSLFTALLNFVLALALFYSFQPTFSAEGRQGMGKHMQFVEDLKWITLGGVDIHYRMAVDGISLLLILLTTFLMVLCVLFSFRVKQRLKEFMFFLLFLETGMIGVFCALDLVLFYVFWEAMLIPMYFLIGVFGHENRIYAAVKFFVYTFAGSVLMLLAIVWIYHITGTFNVLDLADITTQAGAILRGYDPRMLMFLFGAFALAFMIKVPMFPFHTWLPDAHVEAPTAGSVILAGVLLKMGTYGFVRFCLPLFPAQAEASAPLFITLAIIGIIYGSVVAAVQPDAKKLIAYSSVAHLGFVMLGIFSFNQIGMMGALLQNINHGITTPMLFFLIGMLYERRHTREIAQFGGLKLIVPMMATMFLLATLSSIAVPFFNSFVGEFTILVGAWVSPKVGQTATALAATGMVLSAVYMLWWFQRIMLGPVTNEANRRIPDLSKTEWAILTPLVVLIFWIGLGSPFWTRIMDSPVATLIPAATQQVDTNLPIGHRLVGAMERLETVPKRPRGEAKDEFEGLNLPKGDTPTSSEGDANPNMPTSSDLQKEEQTSPPNTGSGGGDGANPAPKEGETSPPTTQPNTNSTPPQAPSGEPQRTGSRTKRRNVVQTQTPRMEVVAR